MLVTAKALWKSRQENKPLITLSFMIFMPLLIFWWSGSVFGRGWGELILSISSIFIGYFSLQALSKKLDTPKIKLLTLFAIYISLVIGLLFIALRYIVPIIVELISKS